MKRLLVIGAAASELGIVLTQRIAEDNSRNILATTRNSRLPQTLLDPGVIDELYSVDLAQRESVQRVAQYLIDNSAAPIDVVNFSGSFWAHKTLTAVSYDEIEELITSHYLSTAFLAKALLPLMAQRGGGTFLTVSCNSVQQNYPELAPFTSVKAAIETLTKCIANEYSQHGVVANSIALPTMLTEKVKREKPNGDFKNYITPEELADFILNLLDQPSPYMNGNVVKIFKHSDSFYNEAYFKRNPSRS